MKHPRREDFDTAEQYQYAYHAWIGYQAAIVKWLGTFVALCVVIGIMIWKG